jgi:acetoacetate decarboxylase
MPEKEGDMVQPISMPWSAPVFGRPPHEWEGVKLVAIPFTPRSGGVERILPPGMEPADGPGMVTLISYPASASFEPYNELVVLVPVQIDGTRGNYVPYIFVTTDEALIAGREIAGFPKKLAQITWEREGARFRGSVIRRGAMILTVEGTVQGPMPADAARSPAAGAPTINYKLIPDPAGGIEIEEITKTQLDVVPREQEMGQARLRIGASEFDPVVDLVPDTEGPMILITADVTIPPGEVLKRIERAERVA